MRLLRPISEDEMVAVFLRTEIDSPRWRDEIEKVLEQDGRGSAVVRRPDLADEEENAYRLHVLESYRAYERREGLFGGFPHDVAWHRASLTAEEVLDILFIDWSWWLTVSGGSRRPRDAARLIGSGAIPGASGPGHEPIAAALRSDSPPRELIAVTTSARSKLVLVEGHVRLTAYALYPGYLPTELELLVGVSDRIAEWALF
jgi:hypothetical protein